MATAADLMASALSAMSVEVKGPVLNPALNEFKDLEWVLLVPEGDQPCSVWIPASSSPLLPLFSSGSGFTPLASSGGLIFGRDQDGKRFLVGNPVTGAWKCIPSPTTDEEDQGDADEGEEEEMINEFDTENEVFEYKMLAEDDGSGYWIIGVAGAECSSWEEINLLYKFHSKSGVWREVDMLNYAWKVSEQLGTPDDLGANVVLSTSGMYNPKTNLVQEGANPEDEDVYDLWAGCAIVGEGKNKQLVIGSGLEKPEELILWRQEGRKAAELGRFSCSNAGSLKWPRYAAGLRFVSIAGSGSGQDEEAEEGVPIITYDTVSKSWHQLQHPASLVVHFNASSTVAP